MKEGGQPEEEQEKDVEADLKLNSGYGKKM